MRRAEQIACWTISKALVLSRQAYCLTSYSADVVQRASPLRYWQVTGGCNPAVPHELCGWSAMANGFQRACSNQGGPPADSEVASAGINSSSSAGLASPRHDMLMVFTCARCETRSIKSFSRGAYERGLVLVRCPGCHNLHLIADHLGWFGEHGITVEQLAAEHGTTFRRVDMRGAADSTASTEQLTSGHIAAEDVAGFTKVQELLQAVGKDAHHGRTDSTAGELTMQDTGGVLELQEEDVESWRRVRQEVERVRREVDGQ